MMTRMGRLMCSSKDYCFITITYSLSFYFISIFFCFNFFFFKLLFKYCFFFFFSSRRRHTRSYGDRSSDVCSSDLLSAMNSLTNAKVMDDTGGLLGWLDGQDKAKPGPVGCVGYCMSGMHITNAASFYPHRIASAASLYGVGIITDKEDSPHLFLDRIKGELYYAFAETDRSVPPHIPGDLKKLLDQHDIKHELKVFPGTEHGFAFPERAIYNTLAAEETWDKMFALWDRTL